MKPLRHFFPLLLLAAMPAVAAAQYTKVVLKWDAVAAVKGYNAYRCADPKLPPSCWLLLNSDLIKVPTTTYTDSAGLVQNTTYYYGVKSVSMSGRESEQFSNIASVLFGPPPPR